MKGIFFAVAARGGKQSVLSLTSLVKASIGRGREAQECVRTISYVHHITPTPNQTFRHPIHLEGESKINGHYKALQLSAPRPFRSAIIFCLFSKLRDSICCGLRQSDRSLLELPVFVESGQDDF